MTFVNWKLVRNPVNWVVVILMLLLGGMVVTILYNGGSFDFAGAENAA